MTRRALATLLRVRATGPVELPSLDALAESLELSDATRRALEGAPPMSPAAARLEGVWRRYDRGHGARKDGRS